MDDHDDNHGNAPDSPCFKNNSRNNNGSNKEQDHFLPIANVGRIMKKVIPGNGKMSKDAKETVQECVSEFISFVTGEASDKCQREKRKTINGDDIIWAITTLGFEDYVNPLKTYLNNYREIEGEKLNVPKQQRSTTDQLEQQQQQQNYHDHQLQCNHQYHQRFASPLPYPTSVYSSTTTTTNPFGALIPQPPFVAPDPTFSLPFFPPSVQKNSQQYSEQIDSVGNW